MRLVEAAVNNNPRHRGDIDNRPAAGLQHQFRFRFAGGPYAGEIDVDSPLPLLALHLQRRIGVGDPGGVNGDIEAAIAAFGQRNGGAQVGNLADMGIKYVDMVVANRKAVEGKPELVQAYMDALTEACEALQNDQKMAADLFVQFLKENGSETSRENCVADLERVQFITRTDWKDRQIGNFAKELGEFYVGQGQLEPNVIDKFETNVVDTFVKGYK